MTILVYPAHAQLGGPSHPFGVVDGQDAGGTAAEAATADPRMGCVYLTPTPLSTSAPLYLCFQICSRFAARAIVGVEGDPARAQQALPPLFRPGGTAH